MSIHDREHLEYTDREVFPLNEDGTCPHYWRRPRPNSRPREHFGSAIGWCVQCEHVCCAVCGKQESLLACCEQNPKIVCRRCSPDAWEQEPQPQGFLYYPPRNDSDYAD